jgi:hypothetical protein
MGFVVIVNIILLSFDRYPCSSSELRAHEGLNIVFTLLFTLELAIMISSYGLKTYAIGQRMN